jgi:hypothetical protein
MPEPVGKIRSEERSDEAGSRWAVGIQRAMRADQHGASRPADRSDRGGHRASRE